MKMICRNGIVAVKNRIRCLIKVRVEEGAAVVTLPGDRTDYVVTYDDELTVRSRGTTAVSPLTERAVVEVSARRLCLRETIWSSLWSIPNTSGPHRFDDGVKGLHFSDKVE